MPLHGVSMRYAFDDADAADRHTTQYFEIAGNRGIYHEGWTAVTKHATPWVAMAELPAFDDDVWELYAPDDWTQAHDLAAEHARQAARAAGAVPASRRAGTTCCRSTTAGSSASTPRSPDAPRWCKGRSQILYGGMSRLTEATVLNIKNVSHAVAADIVVPDGGATGVIIAQGGAFGGWSLYLRHDGVPVYCYNLWACSSTKVAAAEPLAPRHATGSSMSFAYDGGGRPGGDVTLLVDGDDGGARAVSSAPSRWSSRSTRRATWARQRPRRQRRLPARGERLHRHGVDTVLIELADGDADFNHLVDPQLRLSVALARQ